MTDHFTPRSDLPGGTVTFLFTDIEGSTKLLEQLRNEYATVLADQREILRAAFAQFNGYEVDTQGDAFFVAFARALDAVNCVADAQRALKEHVWVNNATVRVRMGLHTGEPIIARTGYISMDVHRAQRIAGAGYGGQVLISQTVRDLIEHDLPPGIALRDLGLHKLKDFRAPVPIYQLVMEGLPSEFPLLKTLDREQEPPTPGEAPFKGLEYFDEADADNFFGREQVTAQLIDYVREHRFLAVVGASGSGKSSVVRAGLIPGLKKGLGAGQSQSESEGMWRTFVITPTAHPLEALAVALTRDSESVSATATLMDDLASDVRTLHLYLKRLTTNRRPPVIGYPGSLAPPHFLVVVDQFEELFTLCRDESERVAFINNLLYAVGVEDGPTTVALTLRADFYAALAPYPELREHVAKHQEYIGPMTPDELRRAIQEPAQRGGWEFGAGLVDLVLYDVGIEPGALPLLSHALLETWKRRRGTLMTLNSYAESGGVRGAIARTAERVFHQELSREQQAIARNLFLRLTELGEGTADTRRRASLTELIPRAPHNQAQETERVLRHLADARLITTSEGEAQVAHEALIREWPQLREWLTQDREGLRLHRHLTEAAHEWELLERDPGALYRGTRLAQARDFVEAHPEGVNELERAFVEASDENEKKEGIEKEQARERELEQARKLAETEARRAEEQQHGARRLRWFAAGLALLLVAALGAAWFGFNQSNIAENNFVTAERIRLAAQAQLALDQGEGGDLPSLLSLQSLKHGYSSEADASLLNALKRGFTKQIYLGHTDLLWSVDFSPDGKKMVTTSNDGTARLWDVATGKELSRFAPSARIFTTAGFLPDGRSIVVGGPGDTLWLWDTETNREVRQYKGLAGGAWGLDVSTDGKFVVTADDKGAKLFDLQTGELLRDFEQSVVASPATISPDGQLVATANGDKTARILDVATGKELRRINASVPWVAFSPDGKLLFSGSGSIGQLWDVQTGEEKQRFVGHTKEIIVGVFSPDGKYLATVSSDKTARLWDITTGQTIQEFVGHTGTIFDVKFSPDGRYLLTAGSDRTARLWDIQAQTEPQRIKTFGSGNELDSSGASGAVSLSPDRQFMISYSDAVGENRGKELSIWNIRTGELHRLVVETTVCTCTISDFAFSPDNRMLLGGGDDGVLWLWDAQSGELLAQFKGHRAAARAVAFSQDGRRLLSASDDKTARLWDTSSGKQLLEFNGHSEPVHAAVFSPDEKFILTGSDAKTARLWDAETGKELRQFIGHTAPVRAVAFSPNGKTIVTGGDDQTVRLWEAQTGKELRQLIGHTAQVSQVAFSPDGQSVLTGSVDQTARLWNMQTGEIVRELVGHVSAVLYSQFSEDGRTILTGDSQNAYRWRSALDDVITFTCSQLTRDLTADERSLYRIADNAPTCAAFTPREIKSQ